VIAFIDDHRDRHGVKPICQVLPIAPASCCEHPVKRSDPARQPDRAKQDAELRPHIQRVSDDNWQVCGVRKVWRQLRREGFDVARCTVARLMKIMGVRGLCFTNPVRDSSCESSVIAGGHAQTEHADGQGPELARI
jgi:hypothetical protein